MRHDDGFVGCCEWHDMELLWPGDDIHDPAALGNIPQQKAEVEVRCLSGTVWLCKLKGKDETTSLLLVLILV